MTDLHCTFILCNMSSDFIEGEYTFPSARQSCIAQSLTAERMVLRFCNSACQWLKTPCWSVTQCTYRIMPFAASFYTYCWRLPRIWFTPYICTVVINNCILPCHDLSILRVLSPVLDGAAIPINSGAFLHCCSYYQPLDFKFYSSTSGDKWNQFDLF